MEGKPLARKRFDHESNQVVKVSISVTEAEKKLLHGLAARFKARGGHAGPSMAQAVVHLVRTAFACLSYHHDKETLEPRKIGHRTLSKMLERDSASLVTKRTLQKPRIYTENPNGTRTWDDEETD